MLDCYLFFDGRCAEAMRFYERALGARIEALMTYADSPQPSECGGGAAAGAAGSDRIMHASLRLGDRILMASDHPPGMPAGPVGGFAVALDYPTAAEARKVFDRLAEGGTVQMPMARTFWSEAFGMLVDAYGTPWMVGGGALKT